MKDWQGGGSGRELLVQGIVAGTLIATPAGWRAVQTLRPGDAVLTVAGGAQPLTGAGAARLADLPLPPGLWPLTVPPGALDNREALLLLPDQRLLILAEDAPVLQGEPFALIAAAALEGWRGIARACPAAGLGVMRLAFAEPQLIYASRATLLLCPGQSGAAPADILALTLAQAGDLVAGLMAEELGQGLRNRAG